MDEALIRQVTAVKNQAGHDVVLNVLSIHVFVDQVVFTGASEDMDAGFQIPINPDTGLVLPARPRRRQDFTGMAEMKEILVHRIDENGQPNMAVVLEFWKPRVFEVFVDPDTLRTVILDVSAAPAS